MTAGNVVDTYAAASLEFCVNVLKSTVIAVLGHNRCGACKAAIAIAKAGGKLPVDLHVPSRPAGYRDFSLQDFGGPRRPSG